jgi:hypothetical protein
MIALNPDCFGNFADGARFEQRYLSDDKCITCFERVGEHNLTRAGQCEECRPDCVDCGAKAHEDSEDSERCAKCELAQWVEAKAKWVPDTLNHILKEIAVWEKEASK